jgi:hypothetical protein
MQHDAADELDVEVPHVERAAAGLADNGERFDEQIVDRLAIGDALTELYGLSAQLLVGEGLDFRFSGADFADERSQPLQFAVVRRTDDFCEEGVD